MTVAPKWIRAQPRGGDTLEEELGKLRRERDSLDRMEALYARVRAAEPLDLKPGATHWTGVDPASGPDKTAYVMEDAKTGAVLAVTDDRRWTPRKGPFGRTPPPPSKPTLPSDASELRRLADGSAQHWHSPIRDRLICEGYVEVTYQPDGRWGGDRITPAGRARLLMTEE